MDLTKLTVEQLKNAIWIHNNGSVPIGGLPVEEYRKELIGRGEDGKGCHEEDYEDCGLSPEQVSEAQAENIKIKKAFALACRILSDYLDCPAADGDANFPECNGENDECGAGALWECWQRYIIERVENEPVCRVCGCTQYNACEGGCYWVEPDLCSKCAGV